jgi:hypothetical protein
MLFTSQYFTIGQQENTTCSSFRTVSSMYVQNWQASSIVHALVGTQSERCTLPGSGDNKTDRDRMSDADLLAQNFFTMKNAHKQLGEIASTDATQINPGPIVSDNLDSLPLFENQIFHEKPLSRQPESPDTESFRSWLKTNTPRHKASPALLERIRSITHEDKA